ncbi:MAG TPA: toprim domain-containing protein [Roseiarcus sp.]|nr:toprim domain-containing protein [Roseiarcus sp.]
MTPARLSPSDLKAMLADRIDELACCAAPDGKRKGRYWLAHSPLRIDKEPSFAIWLTGAGAGAFKDFADPEIRGDAIDLIGACVLKRGDFKSREARTQALAWARDFLGLSGQAPEAARDLAKQARERKRERDLEAARDEARRRRRALEIWGEGQAMSGTAGEAYLLSRGIDARAIANLEHFLRFHPRLSHPHEPHVGPAMLAGFKDPAGGFAAVHCTYLREDGRGKAEVPKAKIIRGGYAGCAIHVSRGPSNLRAIEAASAGVKGMLAITEGIEDGLTIAAERPEWRVWAAGSLGNIGELTPPECADALMVCADADVKQQAIAALNLAVKRLEAFGLPLGVAYATGGAKDFNDLLRGKK